MTAATRTAALIDRTLLASGPARHLGALRIAVGLYAVGWLLVASPQLLGLVDIDPQRFAPVGLVAILHLGPPSATVLTGCLLLTAASGVGFTAGWRYSVCGPAFATGLLVLTSYQNSWGKLLHTENLLVLHVLILAVSPAAAALSVDHPGRGASGPSFGWPIKALALATVLSYLAAGLTKMRYAGWEWGDPENLRNWIAYDLVRKELFGDSYLPIARPILAHAWLFAPAAATTLLIELGAPVALLRRRLVRAWAVSAWLLHLAVLAAMSVAFPYHLSGIPLVAVVLATHRGADPDESRRRTRRSDAHLSDRDGHRSLLARRQP